MRMLGTTGDVASLMSSRNAMCECGSTIPGVRYLPPASITGTPGGPLTFSPKAAILPFFTYKLPLAILPWVTVSRTAFLIRMSLLAAGVPEVCAIVVETRNSERTQAASDFRVAGRQFICLLQLDVLAVGIRDCRYGELLRQTVVGRETACDRIISGIVRNW